MDTFIKLNNQTAGRDKLIRTLQYGSRAYWFYTQNKKSSTYSADVLKSLEYTFSSFRKLLRLGRFLDSLYAALSTVKYPNIILRITLTLSKIANALFLLADHILWIGRVGIVQVDVSKWSSIANRYWLMMLTMNLSRDFYEILQILKDSRSSLMWRRVGSSNYSVLKYYSQVFSLLKERTDIVSDTIKNACDIFIPLTALGYTKLSPGAVGLLGVISSLVGLYTLVDSSAKLVPS
ncbi:peroxisomal membrane protein 11B [Belonocnema kinseyi]|uniref:peroxisomal membrane protein 11B n=1 Tax=Belonocnema kinseyi TaxID=2817044 RepID=UPI00143DBADC|nr:peroxisomal membrane protein 11B [Belonocnema kinseyi]